MSMSLSVKLITRLPKRRKGLCFHTRTLVLPVSQFYFEIALIVTVKALRVNVGLWTPLLPSLLNNA